MIIRMMITVHFLQVVSHIWKYISSYFSLILTISLDWQTGKSTFVEHRTFLHLYRSFHRLWIFLALMFQVNFVSLHILPKYRVALD